jgi:hypothetical protein
MQGPLLQQLSIPRAILHHRHEFFIIPPRKSRAFDFPQDIAMDPEDQTVVAGIHAGVWIHCCSRDLNRAAFRFAARKARGASRQSRRSILHTDRTMVQSVNIFDRNTFPGAARHRGGPAARSAFTIVSMFTDSHATLAERLRASLEVHGLRYELFCVPNVHRSISRLGCDDKSLTKAMFIAFAMQRFRTPILYLDCDVVVRGPLRRIDALHEACRDFAVYNWLSDEQTDCFMPVISEGLPPGRLYKFTHNVDEYAPEQLMCSGPVQYWADTEVARGLLADWAHYIELFPLAADDECLDFAFNNREVRRLVAYAWLDKPYARYAWWPHVQPVIDHPQFPHGGHEPIASSDGRKRYYLKSAELRGAPGVIPRDCFVDVVEGGLFRARASRPGGNEMELVCIGKFPGRLFPADTSFR